MAGTLSVTVDAVYQGMQGPFTGGGTLYATAVGGSHRSVALAGNGQLSAATIAQRLTALGLSGDGVMSNTTYQKYFPLPALTGGGTMTATRGIQFQRPQEFASTGTLTSTAFKTPELTSYTSAGSYTYTIPVWATVIDVVLLGGGGGGKGMAFFDAWTEGGEAGSWVTTRLTRGVDIPWDTTQITGSVGAAGTAGGSGSNGGTGGNSTATGTGMTTLTANGGPGGNQSNLDTPGKSPGSQTFNEQAYTGGAQQNSQSQNGNAPGGGGAGARISLMHGGAGAIGRAWFRAYA